MPSRQSIGKASTSDPCNRTLYTVISQSTKFDWDNRLLPDSVTEVLHWCRVFSPPMARPTRSCEGLQPASVSPPMIQPTRSCEVLQLASVSRPMIQPTRSCEGLQLASVSPPMTRPTRSCEGLQLASVSSAHCQLLSNYLRLTYPLKSGRHGCCPLVRGVQSTSNEGQRK